MRNSHIKKTRGSVISRPMGVMVVMMCVLQTGCLLTREEVVRRVATVATLSPESSVTVREVKPNNAWYSIDRYLEPKLQPSERTQQFLRAFNMIEKYENEPEVAIGWMQEMVAEQPTMVRVHALAEVAELQAHRYLRSGELESAKSLFAVALIHSYQFLFDSKLDLKRNAYDPQFRSICDIYNRSLEGLLRQVCAAQSLESGGAVFIGEEDDRFRFEIEIVGRWSSQKFARFEMVSDYQTEGIQNQYHNYGLGVPLIAVREQQEDSTPAEKYYPPELAMPMTAFCHFEWQDDEVGGRLDRAIVRLYDPLERMTVTADGQVVPLESDITTPLAYHLRDPIISSGFLETASLLNAELAPEYYGMYMLEPFDPNKIPVVMVHGFWSSPMTWIRMFNDLRANHDIHEHYQFWFYSYPTGQPFWLSARQMRESLAKIRQELDPHGGLESLDEMVLVGHSMGGLISTMQTMESDDHFWNMVSQTSIDEFEGDPKHLEMLKETFYFTSNPSVGRVITIASPFAGSHFANEAARWLSKRVFTLPETEVDPLKQIAQQNQKFLNEEDFLANSTSLDSLAPQAKVLSALRESAVAPRVRFHNVVGRIKDRSIFKMPGSEPKFTGDGVVSLESAVNPWAQSTLTVAAEHSKVHQHPACIYEVRRILLANLEDLKRIEIRRLPALPIANSQASELDRDNENATVGESPIAENDAHASKKLESEDSAVTWSSKPSVANRENGIWR